MLTIKNHRGLFVLFGVIGILSGCQGNAPIKNQKPSAQIQKSFSIQSLQENGPTTGGSQSGPAPASSLTVDKARISINKAALDKEFLLQAEVINQFPVPQFN